MRIGINVPWRGSDKKLLDAAGIANRAKLIEDAGLDGIWLGDHIVGNRPDPLSYLLVAAEATTTLEVGTAIYVVPLRNKYDLAQRFVTLETLVPGRFTFGVGTGSLAREYEMAGLAFEDRFKLMREDMAVIRAICDGEVTEFQMGDPAMGVTWGAEAGTPRFVLGAWHSDVQIKRAAAEYDGWMSSAGGLTRIGGWKVMGEAIEKYRDLGGRRALMGSVNIDLRAPTTERKEDDPFFLTCGPEEASDRLGHLEELGYDDVILHFTRSSDPIGGMGYQHDFTAEDLEEIRALVPPDPRTVVGS